ncbi:MAG: glycosyltransferase family 39 protein [Neisseriaceae bacterium]|nr:glycosyltransferase family 39 protein [Neisseriaceae bacterium]
MLTYVPEHLKQAQRPDEWPWALLFLVFVWLWPGIISHDLWRPDEPTIYAAIQSVRQGNILAPILFGEYYLPNSPLFLWLASLSQSLFSPWAMESYTAVRLITALFMAIALSCAGGAGRELLGKYHGRSVVLILIGTPGIMIFGHMMGNTPILFAAICAFLYGIGLSRRKVWSAGILIAGAWLCGFWSDNLPPLLFMWLICALLPFSTTWRKRSYLLSIVVASFLSLPLLIIYPYLLWTYHQDAFTVWHTQHLFGALGGTEKIQLGFSSLRILKNLLWFAMPAWILSIFTIYKIKTLNKSILYLTLLWILLAFILLSLQNYPQNHQLIYLLLPLTLLGAAKLDDMRRGVVAFINWFGIAIFGIAAVLVWLMFFAVNYGFPPQLAIISSQFNPYFTPDWNYFPMLLACSFTPIWLWAITRKNIRGRQAVTNWAAGMTLVWTLLMSLFLPWIDSLKSYRPAVMAMHESLTTEIKQSLINQQDCIISDNRHILTAWNEYGKIPVYSSNQSLFKCSYHLSTMNKESLSYLMQNEIIWSGNRRGQRDDIIVLTYHKD